MDKESKIYVAGHRGLVGSAIWNNLKSKGYTNLVGRTHAELDLLDGVAVREFFDSERPEYVVLTWGESSLTILTGRISSTGTCRYSRT